jgi:fibronectin type 3 domain-containing protein
VGEYDFRVRAIAGDDPGNWCTPITVEIEGGGLETPANLTAAYISTPTPSVKLNWDVVPLAEKYNVFRSVVPHGQPSGIFAIVASPTTNAYDDPSTTPGMTQYYYVTAVKGVEESDPSGVVSVDIA